MVRQHIEPRATQEQVVHCRACMTVVVQHKGRCVVKTSFSEMQKCVCDFELSRLFTKRTAKSLWKHCSQRCGNLFERNSVCNQHRVMSIDLMGVSKVVLWLVWDVRLMCILCVSRLWRISAEWMVTRHWFSWRKVNRSEWQFEFNWYRSVCEVYRKLV